MAQPGGMQIVSVRWLVLRNALIVSRDFDECKIANALIEMGGLLAICRLIATEVQGPSGKYLRRGRSFTLDLTEGDTRSIEIPSASVFC